MAHSLPETMNPPKGIMMIQLDSVSKHYGQVKALDHFTATIRKGELVGLLGPNGAGKTTLMNILTGNLAASSGTALIGGNDIVLSPSSAKRLIGWLPEHVPLYTEMTVASFLRFVCELKRVIPADRDRHIADIARLTGTESILGRRIGNLSKGLQQRVGLAQALCGDPEILILDEPTAGLDPLQAAEFRNLLRLLHENHTILLSSHILADMENICERVLIIRDGRLIRDLALTGEADGDLRLHVRIAMGKDRLLTLLRAQPWVCSAEALSGAEAGITDVQITCHQEDQPERQLFSLLAANQAPILLLTRERSTLEEIFLEAMKE